MGLDVSEDGGVNSLALGLQLPDRYLELHLVGAKISLQEEKDGGLGLPARMRAGCSSCETVFF